MTKECTTCGQHVNTPCPELGGYGSLYAHVLERDCLLRQRDSRDATIRHLKSQLSSTAIPYWPPAAPIDLSVSTLLKFAVHVFTNANLHTPQNGALVKWLETIQTTDYNLSLAIASDIQKVILDATTAAYAQYCRSPNPRPQVALEPGPQSQSPKASPNHTPASQVSAQEEKIGAAVPSDEDLRDAMSEAAQDAVDVGGFSPGAFLSSLRALGYNVIEQNFMKSKPQTTHITFKEGGDWVEFIPGENQGPHHPIHGGITLVHAIKFSDGSIWDALYGWRNPEASAGGGATPSPTLHWKQLSDQTILSVQTLPSGVIVTGRYGLFQEGRGWRAAFLSNTIGWHRSLEAAKSDCEIHAASQHQQGQPST